MNKQDNIYIVDHQGMLAKALGKELREQGFQNVLGDYTQIASATFWHNTRLSPGDNYLFLVGGYSAGINHNKNHPAEMFYDNLKLQLEFIHFAHKFGFKKLLFVGSACMYGSYGILGEDLEETSESYAWSKISGIKMIEAYRKEYTGEYEYRPNPCKYITAVPANMYGEYDTFNNTGHVIPALIHRFHQAKVNGDKSVDVWGTGGVYREFIYVKDVARALIFLMEDYSGDEIVNINCGDVLNIGNVAGCIAAIVGYEGEIKFDRGVPDGALKKEFTSNLVSDLGFRAITNYTQGLLNTYKWYKENYGTK